MHEKYVRQECVALKWRCKFSFEFCENWCGERRRFFTACYLPYIVNLLSVRVKCILCSNQFNHKQIELSTAVQTFTSFDEKRNEHRLCSDHPPNRAIPSRKIVWVRKKMCTSKPLLSCWVQYGCERAHTLAHMLASIWRFTNAINKRKKNRKEKAHWVPSSIPPRKTNVSILAIQIECYVLLCTMEMRANHHANCDKIVTPRT